MKLDDLWNGGPGPQWRVRLAAAGLAALFVVLFVASIALSYVLNRERAQPGTGTLEAALPAAQTMDEWKIQLVTLLQRARRFPPGFECASGTVQLAFRLDRRGDVISRNIETPSGTAAFDQEALDMLARVGRFPAPPEFAPEVMSFTVPIHFSAKEDGCPPN